MPALSLQRIKLVEVLPGKPLPGHHVRLGAEVRHVQGVLGAGDPVVNLAEPGRVQRGSEGRHVMRHGFLETIGGVKAVTGGEMVFRRKRAEAALGGNHGERQEKPRRKADEKTMDLPQMHADEHTKSLQN